MRAPKTATLCENPLSWCLEEIDLMYPKSSLTHEVQIAENKELNLNQKIKGENSAGRTQRDLDPMQLEIKFLNKIDDLHLNTVYIFHLVDR